MIYFIYILNKNIVNFVIFIMNNNINVHTIVIKSIDFIKTHIILNIFSIRIIIYY